MKIAILTQPLGTNYGGILQNYALQRVLKKEGHEPQTLHIAREPILCTPRVFLSWMKRLVHYYLLGRDVPSLRPDYRIDPKIRKRLTAHLDRFIDRHIALTAPIERKIDSAGSDTAYEAYIVGSDQVWRPRYNRFIEENFLSFVPDNARVRKIVYAASFGTSRCEFSDELLGICTPLARRLDAVSVREKSAVAFCRAYFGIEAEQVLDPTLLLDPKEYVALLAGTEPNSSGEVFCYLLDSDSRKEAIVRRISDLTGLPPRRFMPEPYGIRKSDRTDACVYPTVEEWIAGFASAPFVVTDSFHGTVFSILFNKPFITIDNPTRGSDRFDSLLGLFRLRGRMVDTPEKITDRLVHEAIDWTTVNTIRAKERGKSLQFLRNALHTNHE